jgi:ferritin
MDVAAQRWPCLRCANVRVVSSFQLLERDIKFGRVPIRRTVNMLISEALNKAMNAQIGSELGASNQYLMIASYFDAESLPQLAEFFFRQSDEERMHALKILHYVLEAGGVVEIPAISAPPAKIDTAEKAVELALTWEMEVTKQINNLMDIAAQEKDHIGQNFLQWFVAEQLEEVSTMDELLSVVRRAGEQLFFVEQYVAQRGDPHADGGGEEAA